jgi:methyl-accepting chemotaxis protein
LQFEKSIVSHSISSIYEAVQNGKIGSIERDRLLLKYKSQLDTFNKKIGELQLAVDLTELSDMRTQLVSLLEERIETIEGRLTEISQKCGIPLDSLIHVTKRKHATLEASGQEYSKVGEKKGEVKRDSASVRVEDKNIQEVQQEVMQALTRLEHAGEVEDDIVTQVNQTKPDGFTESVAIPSSDLGADRQSHPQNKTHDALSFLNEAEVED